MNGTELRRFSRFEIFTKITYSDLRRNVENLLILKFVFIHCKTVKVSQDDQHIKKWLVEPINGLLINTLYDVVKQHIPLVGIVRITM